MVTAGRATPVSAEAEIAAISSGIFHRSHLGSDAGIVEQPARRCRLVAGDEHPSWQHAERALNDAHILVDDHMLDTRIAQQRFDKGNQHNIIGSEQFVQGNSCRIASKHRYYGKDYVVL